MNLNAGKEQSVAATKSCIAAAAALAAVTAAITEDQSLDRALARLPEALELTTHSTIDPAVISRLAAINEIYAVGRGTGFAVALEAALKAKETCGIHAEAFSLAEVMHGPIRLVRSDFPIPAFLNQDEAYNASRQAVERLVGLGRMSWQLVKGLCRKNHSHSLHRQQFAGSDRRTGAYYRCIEQVAQARGLNPDTPVNLSKVTETL